MSTDDNETNKEKITDRHVADLAERIEQHPINTLDRYYIFKNRGSFLEYRGEILALSNGAALEEFRRRTEEDMGGTYAVRRGSRLTPLEERARTQGGTTHV